jgi:hypothetical protein
MEVTCASSTPRASQLNLKTVFKPHHRCAKGPLPRDCREGAVRAPKPRKEPQFYTWMWWPSRLFRSDPEAGRRVTSEASVGPLVSIGRSQAAGGLPGNGGLGTAVP